MRLGILASHPIQYYAPWFRRLAGQFDLQVFFAHRQDAAGQAAAGFGVKFDWDVPLTEGYPHRWLNNVAARPGLTDFGGCDTPEIVSVIRDGHFDAFLIFGWNRKSYLQAIHACRRNRVPVLMRGDSQLRTPRSRLTTALKYLPYRMLLPRLAAHLYVGQRNRQYLRHYGVPERRLFFAPHFVDNDWFATRAAAARARRTEVRHQWGADDPTLVVLFVGKFIKQKRVADLLSALSLLNRRGGAVLGVLVGAGPLEASLQTLAGELNVQVRFLGFKNQTELPLCYVAADVLVLPSESETWGLVVNEAMACGLPAVVSDAAGCAPDLIVEGQTGYSYPMGDIIALADRLSQSRESLTRNGSRTRGAVLCKVAEYSMERASAGLAQACAVAARRAPGAIVE